LFSGCDVAVPQRFLATKENARPAQPQFFAGRSRASHRTSACGCRVTIRDLAKEKPTMTISDTSENAILNLIFSATTWANYAINATVSPETNIIVALHSADPGDAGTQSTTEIV